MIKECITYLEDFNLLSIVVRLLLAIIMGGIIGFERASKRQAAGLRTFALVCLGSALAVIVNLYLWEITGKTADASRIPSGVVSGVGFWGVGTIVVTNRNHVKGLTTAAGLWTTAALGLALGAGMIITSTLAFVLLIVTISLLQVISRRQEKYNRIIGIYLEVDKDRGMNQLASYIQKNNYEIISMEKKREKILKGYDLAVLMELNLKNKYDHSQVLTEIGSIDGVNYIEEVKG